MAQHYFGRFLRIICRHRLRQCGDVSGRVAELGRDCLPDGRQGRLRRRARASIFPTRCLEAAGLQEGDGTIRSRGAAP